MLYSFYYAVFCAMRSQVSSNNYLSPQHKVAYQHSTTSSPTLLTPSHPLPPFSTLTLPSPTVLLAPPPLHRRPPHTQLRFRLPTSLIHFPSSSLLLPSPLLKRRTYFAPRTSFFEVQCICVPGGETASLF